MSEWSSSRPRPSPGSWIRICANQVFRALQAALLENPEAGVVMPGTGGFRKYRWRDANRSKGKRGGLRVVYYYFAEGQQIWFVAVYGKNDVADLTPAEKKQLKAAVSAELEARRKMRERQRRR